MKLYLALVSAFLLMGCFNSTPEKPAAPSHPAKFSTSYRPPEFPQTSRAEELKKIQPAIKEIFEKYAVEKHIPGLAYGIVMDDTLLFSGGTGTINTTHPQPVSKTSLFRIASMTKSFTAMAILKLRDEGKLSLTDPVAKYIPEMAEITYLTEDAPAIHIQNLLTMSAGFPEDNPWGDQQLDITEEEFLQMIGEGLSFSSTTSTQFEYSNLSYAMLGHIITRVSGKPYQAYITENILNPLGMKNTHWEFDGLPDSLLALGYRWEDEQWKTEPMLHDGVYGAMGGLITSIEDFSKYVIFLLSAWPPHNGPETGPVKRSSVREMQKIDEPSLTEATDADGNPCPFVWGYGYGLVIQKHCEDEVWVRHSGGLPGFGSNYVFFPDYGIGIISFCNLTYAPAGAVNNEVKKTIFALPGIQPRREPVSDILAERKAQLIRLLNTWDTALEGEILAENFYRDKSREHRITEVNKILTDLGEITQIEEIIPENQLRGTFKMHGKNGIVEVYFTLTPESKPKIQQLDLAFIP
ncbi:MAG: serine hydrolase [Bacteroidia bacterium]|nr:serine hydrolase [Bacteroidia bacterium]